MHISAAIRCVCFDQHASQPSAIGIKNTSQRAASKSFSAARSAAQSIDARPGSSSVTASRAESSAGKTVQPSPLVAAQVVTGSPFQFPSHTRVASSDPLSVASLSNSAAATFSLSAGNPFHSNPNAFASPAPFSAIFTPYASNPFVTSSSNPFPVSSLSRSFALSDMQP